VSGNGWAFPGEAEFRADEQRRRRWWTENYPTDRTGVDNRRCARGWPGECPRGQHVCARPRVHPAMCMCYCGDVPAAEPAPIGTGEPVPRGTQGTLL
jgi:hypothetical protein